MYLAWVWFLVDVLSEGENDLRNAVLLDLLIDTKQSTELLTI